MSKQFDMPKVDVGWPVIWRHSRGADPCVGFVTRKSKNTVSLIVFPADMRTPVTKEAVRHRDDPFLDGMVSNDGFWEHTSFSEQLLVLNLPATKSPSVTA
jgi:hypothetical protein